MLLKNDVKKVVNSAMINLYWGIGKRFTEEIFEEQELEYGKNLVTEISNRLTSEYGKGFNRASLFRLKSYNRFDVNA